MKPSWKRNSIIYIIILVAAVLLFAYILPGGAKPEEVPLSEAIAMSQSKQIKEIEIDEETMVITTIEDKELKTFKESNASIYDIEGFKGCCNICYS